MDTEGYDASAWCLRELHCGVEEFSVSLNGLSVFANRRVKRLTVGVVWNPKKDSLAALFRPFEELSVAQLVIESVCRWPNALSRAMKVLLSKGVVERLEFRQCKMLSRRMLSALHSAVGLQTVFFECAYPRLPDPERIACRNVEFEVSNFNATVSPNEKIVALTGKESVISFAVCRMLSCNVNLRLKKLRCSDLSTLERLLSNYRGLEELTMSFQLDSKKVLPFLCRENLRILTLTSPIWLPTKLDFEEFGRFLKTSSIVELNLHSTLGFANALVEYGKLQKLSLMHCTVYRPDEWIRVFGALHVLKELKLLHCNFEHHADRLRVFASIPLSVRRLEAYCLNRMDDIVDLFREMLCRLSLKYLDFDCADRVSEPEVIDAIVDLFEKNTSLTHFSGMHRMQASKSFCAFVMSCSRIVFNHNKRVAHTDVIFASHRNICCFFKARKTAIALVALRKFKRCDWLVRVPRELVVVIAKVLLIDDFHFSDWWSLCREKKEEIVR